MSDNYKIWRPEYDGHAPPNWREGMFEEHRHRDFGITWVSSTPTWAKDYEYRVAPEALNSPNDDAFTAPTPQQWFGQDSIDPIAATVAQLRQYPAAELAKHGITLAEPKDWATELWADLFAVRGMPSAAKSTREGRLDDEDQAAIALIRERVVLKGEG